jgi:DNA-binding response OmpR family regulator
MSDAEPLRVLLVDDNASMRTIVATILKSGGAIVVREAEDGWAAVEALARFPADLVITDMNMAGLDGVAFTRLVRRGETPADRRLPILMMTGHTARARVFEARDAGVSELIAKPLTARALLARIEAVLGRPRPFVESLDYRGPCRRRGARAYDGPRGRRATDRAGGPAR